MRIWIFLLLVIFLMPAYGVETKVRSRSFYMGFTPWPADITPQGIQQPYIFMQKRADIIAHHFDGGVPWLEALENREFSDNLRNDWNYRKANTPKDCAIYLAVTPLDGMRDGLAAYWGAKDNNMPLPAPWRSYRLNDENIKKAYLNYCVRAIEFFKPKYLAIAIEANMLLARNIGKWNEYKELNKFVYTELKKRYPEILIFSTIQYSFLLGVHEDQRTNLELQMPQVKEVLQYSDILALSFYKFGVDDNSITGDFFATALSFSKPMAIAELGISSSIIFVAGQKIRGTDNDQAKSLRFILSEANKHNFLFVIHFATLDFSRMIKSFQKLNLPSEAMNIAKLFEFIGLRTSNGKDKTALRVWDEYFSLPRTLSTEANR